jgi:CopG-like RHH_1 or ribbon-helix-helix domain, RHH_5
VKADLEQLANAERRSISQMAAMLIEEAIARAKTDGRLQPEDDSKWLALNIGLSQRIARVLPNVEGMKRQHDLVFRDACDHQFFGNAMIDAIMVYPKFTIPDFSMKDEAMDASFALPSFIDHDEMIAVFADNHSASDAILLRRGFASGFTHQWRVLRKNFG